jgi:hypothetical protein
MSVEKVDGLHLNKFVSFLREKGWQEASHPNSHITVFRGKPSTEFEGETVVLPATEEMADFWDRVWQALHTVAEIEKKPVAQLLQTILTRGIDVIRARVEFNSAPSGLSLEDAGKVVPLLRNFVGYAACVQSEPSAFFAKASGIARSFAEHCRFGHTFRGSFGFTIECPIPVSADMPLPTMEGLVQATPFERQVIERITRGYEAISHAVAQGNTAPLINNYQTGLNANLCEVLVEIFDALEGKPVEFSTSWAPEIPPSQDLRNSPSMTLEIKAYEVLKAAARELEKVAQPLDTTIMGKIVVLRSEESPSDGEQVEFQRMITMYWEIETNNFVKIRVPLSPAEYRYACDAHKDGKRIKVTGLPTKEGKFWVLHNHRGFEVVDG